MDFQQASDFTTDLIAHYGRRATESQRKTWFATLTPVDHALAERAFAELKETCSAMPTPRAFLNVVASLSSPKRIQQAVDGGEDVPEWALDLARAVMPYFVQHLEGKLTMQEWGEHFAARAKQMKVDHLVDWSQWEDQGFEITVPVSRESVPRAKQGEVF